MEELVNENKTEYPRRHPIRIRAILNNIENHHRLSTKSYGILANYKDNLKFIVYSF